MAHAQMIADLMANLRRSRDVKRKRSSMAPLKNILTKSSSNSTHKTTAYGFLQHYPALMDPRNFLQLIAKYHLKDIVLWANNGRKLPIVSANNINHLYIAQSARHQFRLAYHPGRINQSAPEHIAIIDAVLARDPDAAAAATRHHLQGIVDLLSELR